MHLCNLQFGTVPFLKLYFAVIILRTLADPDLFQSK